MNNLKSKTLEILFFFLNLINPVTRRKMHIVYRPLCKTFGQLKGLNFSTTEIYNAVKM